MKQQIDTSWMSTAEGSTRTAARKMPQQFATRSAEAAQLRLSLEEVRHQLDLKVRRYTRYTRYTSSI